MPLQGRRLGPHGSCNSRGPREGLSVEVQSYETTTMACPQRKKPVAQAMAWKCWWTCQACSVAYSPKELPRLLWSYTVSAYHLLPSFPPKHSLVWESLRVTLLFLRDSSWSYWNQIQKKKQTTVSQSSGHNPPTNQPPPTKTKTGISIR